MCVNGFVDELLFDGIVGVFVILVDDGWLLGVVMGKLDCGLVLVFDYYELMGYFVML